jgi:hypothetical protein
VSDPVDELKWHDNVVRKDRFLAEHDGATIEHLPPTDSVPYVRYQGTVPGRSPVEAADLGQLLDQLEALAAPAPEYL